MFDPLLTLIAAKTKAVGLIAGTAMVTTALVGGGAVAMTAVSDESAVEDSAVVVEEVVDTTAAADLEAVEAVEAVDAVVSATPTVGIDEPGKVRPPLPADFTCDDSLNHGQNVSAYAKSLPKGPGRGAKVSAVAQSDCGKKAGDDAAADEAETAESEVEAAETEEVEESEPAKAEKPAKKAKRAKAAKSKGGGRK